MKIWLLRLLHERDDWCEYRAFVVRAETEQAARLLVASKDNGDGVPTEWIWDREEWLKPTFASCEEILTEGETAIIAEALWGGYD